MGSSLESWTFGRLAMSQRVSLARTGIVPNIRTRATGSGPPYRANLSRWPAKKQAGRRARLVTFESNRSVRRAGGRRGHYLGVVPSVSLRMVYGWRVFRKQRRYWTRLARGCRSRNGWDCLPKRRTG